MFSKKNEMFGKVINAARKKKGITLDVLAGQKTSKGYLSGIENGNVNPPSQRMTVYLSKALGLDPVIMDLIAYVDVAPSSISESEPFKKFKSEVVGIYEQLRREMHRDALKKMCRNPTCNVLSGDES